MYDWLKLKLPRLVDLFLLDKETDLFKNGIPLSYQNNL